MSKEIGMGSRVLRHFSAKMIAWGGITFMIPSPFPHFYPRLKPTTNPAKSKPRQDRADGFKAP